MPCEVGSCGVQASPTRLPWQHAAAAWLRQEAVPALEHFVACAFPYRRDPSEAVLTEDVLVLGPSGRQDEAVGKFMVRSP